MSTIWLHDWAVDNRDGISHEQAMCNDFKIELTALDGIEILLATYGEYGGYDGEAFVLFRKDGKLYEVNGSHCSCYGLEEQWSPEITTIAALRARLAADYFGRGGASPFADELTTLLDNLEARHANH